MDTDATLTRLLPQRDGAAWRITAQREICLGPPGAKHMSGGACSAAMIGALQMETGRHALSCQVQFIAAPRAGDVAEVMAEVTRAGRAVTLATAEMHSASGLGARLTGAFGDRGSAIPEVTTAFSEVIGPEACARIPFVREDEGDLHTHLDMRLAYAGGGLMGFWVKPPENFAIRAEVFLALIADYLPEALHFNLGRRVGAVSLDNTIRFAAMSAARWLFCETTIEFVSGGRFSGRMRIHNEEGALLAFAAQSGLVRELG